MAFDGSQIKVQVFQHILGIDSIDWDRLSGDQPFQSHRWYQYGEQVMSDCRPIYLLAYRNGVLSARASLWSIRNEPLPDMPLLVRKILAALFRRWPLLICRSPLVFTGGLIIAPHENQEEFLTALSSEALSIAKQQGASFLLFDYLSQMNGKNLSSSFNLMSMSEPGTIMENKWSSFEDYLSSGNRKNRQNYNHVLRESKKFGIKITRHTKVEQIDKVLELIRNVEQIHEAPPNPWARPMLEQMETINGTLLIATIGEKFVGCGLLVEDHHVQTTCLLGHAENVPYVYFMILYESLRVAFEHNVRFLRWGSGAYDIKKRLGFTFEDNGSVAYAATNPLLHKVLSLHS